MTPPASDMPPSTPPPQSPPAGWYSNPDGEGLRWWDGSGWTVHIQSERTSQPPPGAPPAPMPTPYPATPDSSGGRERAAVAIAAVILVGAIAIAFFLLSGGSSSDEQRATDAQAKEQALSAQIILETYATNEGTYAEATVAALQSIEPTVTDELELTTTDDSYTLTVPSEGDNRFTISRSKWGAVEFTCEQAGVGTCPLGGNWG